MPFPDLTDLPFEKLLDLTGQTAVVTGGARGIGKATVRRLTQAGATVYSADLSHGVEHAEDSVVRVTLDAVNRDAVQELADRVVSETGRLDIWVNGAGVFPAADFLEITDNEWHRVLRTNLDSTFFGSQIAGRAMSAAGGVIVNISSIAAFRASDNAAHYRASKAAQNALTENLARELGPAGVRAVAICPTVTRTEGFDKIWADQMDDFDRFGESLPAGRVALPDDIARVVLFAVSPLGAFMTGEAIPVDGGHLVI